MPKKLEWRRVDTENLPDAPELRFGCSKCGEKYRSNDDWVWCRDEKHAEKTRVSNYNLSHMLGFRFSELRYLCDSKSCQPKRIRDKVILEDER